MYHVHQYMYLVPPTKLILEADDSFRMIDLFSSIYLDLKEMCTKVDAARLGDLIVRRSVAATCDLIDF